MSYLDNSSMVKRFFSHLYSHLKNIDKEITEVWLKESDINMLTELDKINLYDFLSYFDFIRLETSNYSSRYLVIDKILFILESLKYLNRDIKEISELLDFNGFEALVMTILNKSSFHAIKNFRFSDKSNFKSITSQKKYEIDVIGIYRNLILIIDAKQWRKKDTFSSMNKAANLQYQRVLALKENPDVFSNLIHKLLGLNPKIKNLPFKLIPMMVSLEDNRNKINDNQVPIVSISQFMAFLRELPNNMEYFKVINIKKVSIQKQLQI